MAQRVFWDISEAVIMLDALISSYENKMSRKEAIEYVSSKLRARAKRNGIYVDDVFRNINGITLQMSTMEYILTNGKKGIKKSSISKVFQDAVAMYRNDRATYEKTLREARSVLDVKSIQNQYFTWLETQVSPAQLSELYMAYIDIENFCLEHNIIKKKLFLLTNHVDIRKVMDTVACNKVFHFKYKKNISKMNSAMQFYYRFVKKHSELFIQATPMQSIKKVAYVETTHPASSPAQTEHRGAATPSTVDTAINKIDFTNIQTLAFTKPVSYSYLREGQVQVNSWTQLYVHVVKCLLDDYTNVLIAYTNRNIDRHGWCDFSNEIGMCSMTAPKKLKDNFYLETNLSPTNIVNKIKKLLELCNVDYENLEIFYQKQNHTVSTTNASAKTPHVHSEELSVSNDANSFVCLQDASEVVKEAPEPFAQISSMQSIKKLPSMETKPPVYSPAQTKYRTTAPSTTNNAISKIDFTNIQTLAFTKPMKYSYFGDEQTNFKSWKQFYVQVVQCLLSDYADVLIAYTNCNIGGNGRWDFSDETGMRNMTAPKKVKDNFYLETNLSATDIVRKIKKLLDLCNVDYENLEIFYQTRNSTTSPRDTCTTTPHIHAEEFSVSTAANSSADLQDISEDKQIRYAEILSEYFSEDGYRLGRVIAREQFKQFYAEKYGSNLAETDACIDKIMSVVGVKRDDRIFPKQDNKQNDLALKIVNDILSAFASGVTAVYIEAIYDKYQQQLANDLHIYNQDALTSLLMDYANGKYIRYTSLLTNNLFAINEQEDFIRIMKTFHQPQKYAAIHEKAWFLPFKKMKNLLAKTESIVNVAAETYFYAPNLPISAEEITHLSSLMTAELNYNSYITDVQLKQLIVEKCPSIAINTDGYTTLGLRKCLTYIFREQFTFNGHIITFKDKTLSTTDVFAEFAKNHKMLSVEELYAFSNEINISINWDAVFSEMIRVSDKKLVRKDQIKFDEEATDDILDKICQEDYLPLPEINLFLHFPNIGYPWNSYLLESYLFSCSKKFCLLHSSFMKTGVYGAMVRKEANISDYNSLLVDVLSKSNALASTQIALQYIVDKGYQQRRRYEGIENVIKKAKLIKEQREKQEK